MVAAAIGSLSSPRMTRKSTPGHGSTHRARVGTCVRRGFRRAPSLVPPVRARSALAPHPRSVPDVVSEFMLQQTQVHGWRRTTIASWSGTPPSRRWRARSRAWCGRAGKVWATIGGRRTCTASRGGGAGARRGDSEDPAVLRRLPGVGRYTAGAVASFAFERRPRRWIPTSPGCIRRAFHPSLAPRRSTAPSGRRRRRLPRRRGPPPGPSIRPSWSWAP